MEWLKHGGQDGVFCTEGKSKEIKTMNRLQKRVAGSPARGLNLACDFMVVQELGNVWPGWRVLGKGIYAPSRFLSPPWGKQV